MGKHDVFAKLFSKTCYYFSMRLGCLSDSRASRKGLHRSVCDLSSSCLPELLLDSFGSVVAEVHERRGVKSNGKDMIASALTWYFWVSADGLGSGACGFWRGLLIDHLPSNTSCLYVHRKQQIWHEDNQLCTERGVSVAACTPTACLI